MLTDSTSHIVYKRPLPKRTPQTRPTSNSTSTTTPSEASFRSQELNFDAFAQLSNSQVSCSMPPIRTHGVQPIGLNSRTIRLGTSYSPDDPDGTNPSVSIHEDIICSRSLAFRHLLQKNRKPIDGDCSICKLPANSATEQISFCAAQCGQKFHTACLRKWLSSSRKCPYCRSDWKSRNHQAADFVIEFAAGNAPTLREETIRNVEKMNLQRALGVYVFHLYTKVLELDVSIRQELGNGEWLIYLLSLYLLGDILRDKTFKIAILDAMAAGVSRKELTNVIRWIFDIMPQGNILCEFIDDSFAVFEKKLHSEGGNEWGSKALLQTMLGNDEFTKKYASDEPCTGFSIEQFGPATSNARPARGRQDHAPRIREDLGFPQLIPVQQNVHRGAPSNPGPSFGPPHRPYPRSPTRVPSVPRRYQLTAVPHHPDPAGIVDPRHHPFSDEEGGLSFSVEEEEL